MMGWSFYVVAFQSLYPATSIVNKVKKKKKKEGELIIVIELQHPHPLFSPGRIGPVIWTLQTQTICGVQLWQSDCIVEQAAEFIRKKLARRSAGLALIGQSRGPLRLRAPQTFLRIIFSIPLLSSVRTDQITAQGLHCEGLFKKLCFQCCPSLMLSLSHLIHHKSKKAKMVFPS